MALSRAPAPPELDILTSTVVRPAGKSNGDTRDEAERTPLSAFDQTIVATVSVAEWL